MNDALSLACDAWCQTLDLNAWLPCCNSWSEILWMLAPLALQMRTAAVIGSSLEPYGSVGRAAAGTSCQGLVTAMNFASLPMYDLPEIAGATDAWWAGLASHMRREGLVDIPDVLSRPADLEQHWTSPQLLFSQTCGYPLTHRLRGKVQLAGLPVYACRGCTPDGFYSSMIVVPASSNIHSIGDCRRRRAVFNTSDSMSGLLALRYAASQAAQGATGDQPFFTALAPSGGHRRSLEAVAGGKADVATIDAVTFALLERHDPELVAGVRVLGTTRQVPGLPYISAGAAPGSTLSRIRNALREAFADPALADVRGELLLRDIRFPEPRSYDVILELEAEVGNLKLA